MLTGLHIAYQTRHATIYYCSVLKMETNINNRNGDVVKYNSVNDYNKHHGERDNYY